MRGKVVFEFGNFYKNHYYSELFAKLLIYSWNRRVLLNSKFITQLRLVRLFSFETLQQHIYDYAELKKIQHSEFPSNPKKELTPPESFNCSRLWWQNVSVDQFWIEIKISGNFTSFHCLNNYSKAIICKNSQVFKNNSKKRQNKGIEVAVMGCTKCTIKIFW